MLHQIVAHIALILFDTYKSLLICLREIRKYNDLFGSYGSSNKCMGNAFNHCMCWDLAICDVTKETETKSGAF